jgi:hypothetical protein
MSKAMSYPSIPDKVIGVLGEQATKQLYDMREMVSTPRPLRLQSRSDSAMAAESTSPARIGGVSAAQAALPEQEQ